MIQIYIFYVFSTFEYSNPISNRILLLDNTDAKSTLDFSPMTEGWVGQGICIIGRIPDYVPKEKLECANVDCRNTTLPGFTTIVSIQHGISTKTFHGINKPDDPDILILWEPFQCF